MGVRLIQEGLRDLGQGARDFGAGFEAAGEMANRREQQKAKEDAERIKKERLQSVSGDLDNLIQEASQNPEFDRTIFAERLKPLAQKSIELEDPRIFNTAFQTVDQILKARETEAERQNRLDAATITAGGKDEVQKKRDAREHRKEVREIVKGHEANETSKRTSVIRESFGRVKAAASGPPSAVKDLSMVFNYMKSLDPQSVVRESEFKSAANARGFFEKNLTMNEDGTATTENGTIVPSFVVRAMQKLDPDQKGAFLSPEQRQEFLSSARDNFKSQLNNQRSIDERVSRQLQSIDEDPSKHLSFMSSKELEDLEREQQEKVKESPKAAVLGKEPIVKFVGANKEAIFQAANRINEQRAARGEPPLSADERLKIVDKILSKGGFTRDPSVTLEDLGLHGGL